MKIRLKINSVETKMSATEKTDVCLCITKYVVHIDTNKLEVQYKYMESFEAADDSSKEPIKIKKIINNVFDLTDDQITNGLAASEIQAIVQNEHEKDENFGTNSITIL